MSQAAALRGIDIQQPESYRVGRDEEGHSITLFPDGTYVNGGATPALLKELNRLNGELNVAKHMLAELPEDMHGNIVLPNTKLRFEDPDGNIHIVRTTRSYGKVYAQDGPVRRFSEQVHESVMEVVS